MIKQPLSKPARLILTFSMIFLFYPIMGLFITLSVYEDAIYLEGILINGLFIGLLLLIVGFLRFYMLKQAKIDKSITVSEKTFYKVNIKSLIKIIVMTLIMYLLALSVIISFYAPINYLYPAVVNVSYVIWFSKVLNETKLYNPFDTFILLNRSNKGIYIPKNNASKSHYFIER